MPSLNRVREQSKISKAKYDSQSLKLVDKIQNNNGFVQNSASSYQESKNNQALILKEEAEDRKSLKKQVELNKQLDKQTAEIIIQGDESRIPYSDMVTYNWEKGGTLRSRESLTKGYFFNPPKPVPNMMTDAKEDIKLKELLNFSADEIWVIAKVDTSKHIVSDDTPGTGAMLAKFPKQEKEVPLPLKHTDVKGDICGYIATVEVMQQFHNPYSEKIEAKYVFPLPQNAAVNEFIMIIGDRKIRGIIRELEEAEQIYKEARNQGYVASYTGKTKYLHAECRQHRAWQRD